MMMLQVFGWVLLLITFGQVDLIETDFSNDYNQPVVELDNHSLHEVFDTVDPYVWTTVNSTYSLSLTEEALDDLHDEYLVLQQLAPYERSTSTIGEATMTDCVITFAFVLLWVFALPYAIKRIKKAL